MKKTIPCGGWASKAKHFLIETTAIACLAFVVVRIFVTEIESLIKCLSQTGIVEQFRAWLL